MSSRAACIPLPLRVLYSLTGSWCGASKWLRASCTLLPQNTRNLVQRVYLKNRTLNLPSASSSSSLLKRTKRREMDVDGGDWYSVWAQPPHQQQVAGLAPAMLKLRDRFQAPQFEPHVTVLGVQRLPFQRASEYLQSACRSLRPFTCHLKHVDCGQSFYQCVYMVVETSEEVMQANLHVRSSFKLLSPSDAQKTEDYMPHLSLMYGDLTNEDKQEAKKIVEEEFGPVLCNTQFQVSSLSLYRTDTHDRLLNSWRKVAEYPLEGDI